MKYFTITELCRSDTAIEKGIDNTAPPQVRVNLSILVNNLLDPLREAWRSPIKVTSGFRCGVLNRAVGGASTSAHLYGYAADVVPMNGNMSEFKEFVTRWAQGKKFDQILLEKDSKGREWVHIGYKNGKGLQRGQLRVLNVK